MCLDLPLLQLFKICVNFFDSLMTCWKTRTTYQSKAKIHYYFCDFMVLLSRRRIYFSENAAFQLTKRALQKNMARGWHFKIPAPCLFLSMTLRRCSIGKRNKGLWFDCSSFCFSPFLVGVGVFCNILQQLIKAVKGENQSFLPLLSLS